MKKLILLQKFFSFFFLFNFNQGLTPQLQLLTISQIETLIHS